MVVHDAGPVDCVRRGSDIVGYGPEASATLDALRAQGVLVAGGRHDHPVALRADPKATAAKQPPALTIRDQTRSRIDRPTSSGGHGFPYDCTKELEISLQFLDRLTFRLHTLSGAELLAEERRLGFVSVRQPLQAGREPCPQLRAMVAK